MPKNPVTPLTADEILTIRSGSCGGNLSRLLDSHEALRENRDFWRGDAEERKIALQADGIRIENMLAWMKLWLERGVSDRKWYGRVYTTAKVSELRLALDGKAPPKEA